MSTSNTVRRALARTAVAIIAAAAAVRSPVAAQVRSPAPAVSWQGADGTTVRLSETKGRVVLVDFWASWCPPCKESFPALDIVQRDYRDRGVVVVAVNVDERRKDADVFLAAHPHTVLVVFDPHGDSPKAFKVRGMPTSFVIDRRGEIRYTRQGYARGTDAEYRRELDSLLAEPAN